MEEIKTLLGFRERFQSLRWKLVRKWKVSERAEKSVWFPEQMGDSENQRLKIGKSHCLGREDKIGPTGQITFLHSWGINPKYLKYEPNLSQVYLWSPSQWMKRRYFTMFTLFTVLSFPIPSKGRQRWRDGELGVHISERTVSQGPLRLATGPHSWRSRGLLWLSWISMQSWSFLHMILVLLLFPRKHKISTGKLCHLFPRKEELE